MLEVKVFLDNGNEILTRINCSEQEAKDYYIGKIFNVGTKSDRMAKCVRVEVKYDTIDRRRVLS